jgi:DNA-binding GntR family transcriptional regulator
MARDEGGAAPATVAQGVADSVRRRVITGEAPAGTRITERGLSEEFGVSRGAVREAIRILRQEGFVDLRPNAGARVIQFDRAEIDEIASLRRQVEYFAVPNAAVSRDPADVAALRRLTDEMHDAHAAGDGMRLIETDLRFHKRICVASRHPTLDAVMGTLLPRLMVLWYPNALRGHSAESFAASHARIVDAIEARDVAAGIEAIDAHMRNFSLDLDVDLTPVRH